MSTAMEIAAKELEQLIGDANVNGSTIDKLIRVKPAPNNISPTLVRSFGGTLVNSVEGTKEKPSNDNLNPVMWVQKFTDHDSEGDRFAHNIGGGLFEVYMKGSRIPGSQNVENTWMALVANTVQDGINTGTSTDQDWDSEGNVIGLAAFARSNGYNRGITTALWGYASSPELDDETFDNLPSDGFTITGLEINLDIRHKDPGIKNLVAGHGTSVGEYLVNYRAPGRGVRNWSFGIAFNGSPDDGNFASTDIDNWNGFWTGILLDKIKGVGIKFGRYFKDGSYGIEFPDSFIGSQQLSAGIYMGGTKFNLGRYTGSEFNNRDMWVYNGVASGDTDNIQYRRASINENMFGSRGVTNSDTFNQTHRMRIRVAGREYFIPLEYISDVS